MIDAGGAARRARRAANIGALAGLAAAGGYCLAGVPNIEVMTLIVFVSGWLVGAGGGAAAGSIAMLIYTAANPYGAALPALAASQVLGMALIGCSGGLWSRLALLHGAARGCMALGAVGGLLTLAYDLATNVAIGISFSQIVPTLAAGVPFSLIHVSANALIFALGGPYLIRGLSAAGLMRAEGALR